MKIAVIGSREAPENAAALILKRLPKNTTEIITGGANGIDRAAEETAQILGVPVRLFLPQYERYGKKAPLFRNLGIIDYADEVLAFWNGRSKGTQQAIATCIQKGKPVRVFPLP